jgi:hypothetical protein
MTRAVQRRVAARRVPAAIARRRVASTARRPAAPKPRRRGLMVLLLVGVALAVWLWPRGDPEPLPSEPEHAEAPAPPPRHAAARNKVAKPAPPATNAVDEARLRAALQERAPDLRACVVPPGAPPQIPARLRVAADGKTRTVDLTSPVPIPASLASCLRERMSAWRFDDLRLQSEVAVLVTFALR